MMKKITTAFAAAILFSQIVSCCGGESKKEKCCPECSDVTNVTPAIPSMTDAEIQAGILTPEVLLKMRRLSGETVSPNGVDVLYSLSVQDVENNGTYSNLYVINSKTKETRELTKGTKKNFDAQWSADGNTIYFTSTRGGSAQIWKMGANGENPVQISNIDGGIGGFKVSPKGDKVWYIKTVKVDKTKDDIHPNLPKSKSRIYDDLMVRHWDYWLDGTYQHLFLANLDGTKLSADKDLVEGGSFDVPMAPYFDCGEITWNNAGTQIAYTAKKMNGKEYALSTDSDIYIYDLASGDTKNITKGMLGYDKYPVYSEDDSMIAFTSMRRPGNEADKSRLMIYSFSDGSIKDLTPEFDYNTSAVNWVGNTIYFLSPIEATEQICRVDVTGDKAGKVEVITKGDHTFNSLHIGKDALFGGVTTISSCNDLLAVDRNSLEISPLTDINKEIYKNVKMGEVQKRWVKTTDGKNMLVWVTLPPNFDPNKKYPTLLYCQGGPQSTVANQWSFRWNFQLMAAQGYVVVSPNRRGLPSFGQEWLDQISGDYSGQNIKDYLAAIDDVAKESWVNKDKMGCVGASYGGYSVYFLAGHHNNRFKALISHCGMFNLESFYGSTEELWFPTNDLGGSYFSNNATAKRSYANSPHKFVDKWNTPILIIVGEKDYRIPYTQSLEAFTAARLKGLDARLLSFEDEGHQVFKPQNALVWHSEFFGWLNKHLKN